MEEKLQKILDEYSGYIERYKSERDKLMNKITFCRTHIFKEEERITYLKYEAITMIISDFENMHTEIQDMLNKWKS